MSEWERAYEPDDPEAMGEDGWTPTPEGRCPEHYPDDGDCPDEGRVPAEVKPVGGGKPTTSPFVRAARDGRLPYKVCASLSTDARVCVVREPLADILRRTLPPTTSPEV